MAKKKTQKTPTAKSDETDAQPWVFRFTWENRSYEITVESLTFGERGELEDHMGQPWPLLIMSAWSASYKFLTYMAYLAVRREKADVSLNDFTELSEDSIEVVDERDGGESDRPTEAGDETNGSPSSSSSGSSPTT